ncbi:DUF7344 domain-containing protein [Halorussus marinus]|uniref:DUF7344 domain-containing protein n=1 Tax=Halorussus marinus TaxID=2505976 RepID=UPI001ADC3263|nr:hypothetical protein [Halorussus marinus]
MSDDGFGSGADEEKPTVSDGGTSLLSRVFGALAEPRRRYVLYYLREHGRARVDDLAIQIGAWERDVATAELSVDDVEQITLELVHTHLPKLEDAGLVGYDRRTETVSYDYPPSLLDEALDIAAMIEDHP